MKPEVLLYTDGSSRGNPGPGGYGSVLIYKGKDGVEHKKEMSGGEKETTNNRMELMGVIAGLEALNRPCSVTVITDSKYVSDAFNQHWIEGWKKRGWKTSDRKPVLNQDLWFRLLKDMEPHSVTYKWVKGHAGNEYNERCDLLATTAADSFGG